MPKADTRPTVIDLFSGVGGLSLGAARAGFRVAASVELDPIASKSHRDNFPRTAHLQQDVSTLSGETLLEAAGLRQGQLDGLIGGPPCQGFSLIGRQRDADPRNDLFGHFFRLVAETRPAFYLAENVPGILGERYQNFIERAMSAIPKSYVRIAPFKVRANLYGAPTTRTRVFFIGYDPDRIDALSQVDFAPSGSTKQTFVRDALKGLRNVEPHWQSEADSWRTVGELPKSPFWDRVTNKVPRDVGNPEALRLLKSNRRVSGFLGTAHSPETIARFDALMPGEIDRIYRSPRLNPIGFCPTLRAGTGSDRGSYQAVRPIHPKSPRVISPREAARLQGFPDWFVFNPTKWHSFRQIGNSVSPIVSESLLNAISRTIESTD
ncbi:DNA cytosine methyltransferase [Thermomonas sp.]|jgi:DNA (cytosine-5)-methyltransferase 1|uniref:DNA cytosine methyltransferase n=1 Tax=Thermomonas sp. TaxID=1971895 RepID=UPI00257DC663|nr:DNA cytosine methyltransferase [Thermomonas sp.]